ncbi:TadE/TadG family type IV pilus assembly protein [Novosphingobium sp. M1R2S20]|uniref:TadE/TadG family type IV pilus assembly protein n=1 Tax=Novosphingobium rhizovicinum TaxID=3228928 RepID=A0ABV3RHW3_9SPHN
MMINTAIARVRSLYGDKNGNVLIFFALSLVPMIIAAGMVIDYTRAAKTQTRMNAIADATALYAVSPPMLKLSANEVAAKAKIFFNDQVGEMSGVIYGNDVSVDVVDASAATVDRTAAVNYAAKSVNIFSAFLGMDIVNVGGGATSKTKTAPNVDFYMMLDTSPSMALPATSAGLLALTKKTNGCAFACHQTNTTKSDPGSTYMVNGKYVDYYYIAKNDLKLELRSDLVNSAVSDLVDVAKAAAVSNKAKYRMALGNFDYKYHSIQDVPGDLDLVKGKVSQANLLVVCRNNQRVCDKNDNDRNTNFTAAWKGINAILPAAPGEGTNQAGDTPQVVLFLITDGMRDEDNGGRALGPMPTSMCQTIKNRGIKIAVLYTEYLYESASDDWSIKNIRTPYLASPEKIGPPLKECASPGLYYRATTDDDISGALASLFQKAVQAAHLVR